MPERAMGPRLEADDHLNGHDHDHDAENKFQRRALNPVRENGPGHGTDDDAGDHFFPDIPAHGAHAHMGDEGGEGCDEYGRGGRSHGEMLNQIFRYAHAGKKEIEQRNDDDGFPPPRKGRKGARPQHRRG